MSLVRCGSKPMVVTALILWEQRDLLLAGKGSYIYLLSPSCVHSSEDAHSLRSRVFDRQPVLGLTRIDRDDEGEDGAVFAAWGGNLLRIFCLVRVKNEWELQFDGDAVVYDSRILDCCALPNSSDNSKTSAIFTLTAHNEVYSILTGTIMGRDAHQARSLIPTLTCKGVSAMLYSGHMLIDQNSLIIASGTMFGQVLVWSCSTSHTTTHITSHAISHASGTDRFQCHSLASFHEHEGSVFGVRLVKMQTSSSEPASYRVASCSDDRTIRVYAFGSSSDTAQTTLSVPRTGFAEFSKRASVSTEVMVSSTSAHASRVWSVQWLSSGSKECLLLSFGEDGTVQVWQLKLSNGLEADDQASLDRLVKLGFHSGKNIWSYLTFADPEDQGLYKLYTGGADGRIVEYRIRSPPYICDEFGCRFEIEWPLSQGKIASAANSGVVPEIDRAEMLFIGLEGTWSIHRIIDSKRSQYPSGTFNGNAIMAKRTATDPEFDGEMLYSEEGTFATDTGLSFPARRSYVYRYQRNTKTITAWFVKPDATEVVDYLFHQVEFKEGAEDGRRTASGERVRLATGYHLCVRDHYNAEYTFDDKTDRPGKWALQYHVTGPEKDYTATSNFTRAVKPEATRYARSSSRNDAFRSFVWASENLCVAATDTGKLLTIDVSDVRSRGNLEQFVDTGGVYVSYGLKPRVVLEDKNLASYSLLTNLWDSGVLVADGFGGVHHIPRARLGGSSDSPTTLRLWKFESKVTFLYAQALGGADPVFLLIFQSLRGRKLWWTMTSGSSIKNSRSEKPPLVTEFKLHQLDLSGAPVITCARLLTRTATLICGSRHGDAYTWVWDSERGLFLPAAAPYHHIRAIHGTDKITSIHAPWKAESSSTQQHESPGAFRAIGPHHNSCKDHERLEEEFFTTGRDGQLKRHVLTLSGSRISHRLRGELSVPSLAQIEGFYASSDLRSLAVWGFQGSYFVVWNLSRHCEISRFKCGNGNRIWDFVPVLDGITIRGALIWAQGGAYYIHRVRQPSHSIISAGGHGREIKALDSYEYQDRLASKDEFERAEGEEEARSTSRRRILATGAEDTDIRLYEVHHCPGSSQVASEPNLDCFATLRKHSTGLTALKFWPRRNLLFSCGGKEELFVWRLWLPDQADLPPAPCTVCIATCPKVTKDGDLRVMDADVVKYSVRSDGESEGDGTLLIAAAYSDSSLRLWNFDEQAEAFTLVAETQYGTNCLTCVKFIQIHGEDVLLVTSTDGHLVMYSTAPSAYTGDAQGYRLRIVLRQRIHQSAIKSMATCNIEGDEILIVTGGDDNAVGFTRITGDRRGDLVGAEQEEAFFARTILVPRAHAAAVNAVRFFDSITGDGTEGDGMPLAAKQTEVARDVAWHSSKRFRVATASNDQNVKAWQLDVAGKTADEGQWLMLKKDSTVSDVADATGLDCFGRWIVVAGVGLETIDKTTLYSQIDDTDPTTRKLSKS